MSWKDEINAAVFWFLISFAIVLSLNALASGASYDAAVVAEVNKYRVEAGVAPLTLDTRLSDAAVLWAKLVKPLGVLVHDAPISDWPEKLQPKVAVYDVNGDGWIMVEDRHLVCGFPCGYASECGALTPWASKVELLVNQWYRSPGHRAIMLSPTYRYGGCGKGSGWAGKTLVFLEVNSGRGE